MLSDKINLKEKLSKFNKHWSPRIIAEMNDYQFKVAKIKGEFVWHDHNLVMVKLYQQRMTRR